MKHGIRVEAWSKWRQLESNRSIALKTGNLLIPRVREIQRLSRMPDLRTNRVQTIPRIPAPPTALPSNPFSGPSEEYSIVYTSNRRRRRWAFDEDRDVSSGTAFRDRSAESTEVASCLPNRRQYFRLLQSSCTSPHLHLLWRFLYIHGQSNCSRLND